MDKYKYLFMGVAVAGLILCVLSFSQAIEIDGLQNMYDYKVDQYNSLRESSDRVNKQVSDLNKCLDRVYDDYIEHWDSRCATLSRGSNCELGVLQRYDLNEEYLDGRLDCFEEEE